MTSRTAAAVDNAIQNLGQLEDRLSEPTDAVIESLGRLDGDIIVLGVAGKMGPTLGAHGAMRVRRCREGPSGDRRGSILRPDG